MRGWQGREGEGRRGGRRDFVYGENGASITAHIRQTRIIVFLFKRGGNLCEMLSFAIWTVISCSFCT